MSAADLLRDRRVAPSILSADYARLGDQVREVMDGHFVPPITIGPLIVDALAEQVHEAGGILDVHLMIERPERHVDEFARAGADSITVHIEATPHVHYAVMAIKEAGCTAGAAITPSTPVEAIAELAEDVAIALCMTVNPGWGGQAFIPSTAGKVERLRAQLRGGIAIQVDGGIDESTGPKCAVAGARLFVAGSAVMGAPDPAEAYVKLARAVDAV